MQFLEKLLEVPPEARLEETRPVGPFGLLWPLRSKECREGLGVLVELIRALGGLKGEPPPIS